MKEMEKADRPNNEPIPMIPTKNQKEKARQEYGAFSFYAQAVSDKRQVIFLFSNT